MQLVFLDKLTMAQLGMFVGAQERAHPFDRFSAEEIELKIAEKLWHAFEIDGKGLIIVEVLENNSVRKLDIVMMVYPGLGAKARMLTSVAAKLCKHYGCQYAETIAYTARHAQLMVNSGCATVGYVVRLEPDNEH